MSRIAGVGQVGMNMRREDGIAMIGALMAMQLMAALGAALVMTTTSETIIAGNFSRGPAGLHVADAAFDRARDDLLTGPAWIKLPDGTTGGNLGPGVLARRAEAFGPRGAHKIIEMTVARTNTTNLERGYPGQRGEDEQNRRARKAAVQTPGKSLTMQSMTLNSGGIQ